MGYTRGKITSTTLLATTAVIFAVGAVMLAPELSFAGTGGAEFAGAETRIVDIIGGTGGKLVAALALGFAAVGSIFKFNLPAVASALGVGLLASGGVAMVQSGITGLI